MWRNSPLGNTDTQEPSREEMQKWHLLKKGVGEEKKINGWCLPALAGQRVKDGIRQLDHKDGALRKGRKKVLPAGFSESEGRWHSPAPNPGECPSRPWPLKPML